MSMIKILNVQENEGKKRKKYLKIIPHNMWL